MLADETSENQAGLFLGMVLVATIQCLGWLRLCDCRSFLALTAKLAIRNSQKPGGHGFIAFQPEWFDEKNPAVPEAQSADDANRLWDEESRNLGLV